MDLRSTRSRTAAPAAERNVNSDTKDNESAASVVRPGLAPSCAVNPLEKAFTTSQLQNKIFQENSKTTTPTDSAPSLSELLSLLDNELRSLWINGDDQPPPPLQVPTLWSNCESEPPPVPSFPDCFALLCTLVYYPRLGRQGRDRQGCTGGH